MYIQDESNHLINLDACAYVGYEDKEGIATENPGVYAVYANRLICLYGSQTIKEVLAENKITTIDDKSIANFLDHISVTINVVMKKMLRTGSTQPLIEREVILQPVRTLFPDFKSIIDFYTTGN